MHTSNHEYQHKSIKRLNENGARNQICENVFSIIKTQLETVTLATRYLSIWVWGCGEEKHTIMYKYGYICTRGFTFYLILSIRVINLSWN